MFRDIIKDGGESSNFERGVVGNGDVVLGRIGATQTHMASCLAGFLVSQEAQCLYKLPTGEGPRKLHAVITSSRTK